MKLDLLHENRLQGDDVSALALLLHLPVAWTDS